MKATVVGTGLMGVPVAYGLCKLGLDVSIADQDEDKEISAAKTLESLECKVQVTETYEGADVVVSCIPYHATYALAEHCLKQGIRYCDLGGNSLVSSKIWELAKLHSVPAFTDLGLAPGFANILAEDLYNQVDNVYSVKICVGGLPVYPTGSLQYARVFNTCGLRNEYSGDCEVLIDGCERLIPALSEYGLSCFSHYVDKDITPLEEFNTSGGLSHTLRLMKERGVKECDYKTLRYAGHLRYIKFLLEECKLSDEEFDKAIKNACPETKEDTVHIFVHVGGRNYVYKDVIVDYDENWTAMQKGTAFPTASVAAIMATGELDEHHVLDYSHVPLNAFYANLSTIGGIDI